MTLRDRARHLFDVACKAADPALALSRALSEHPFPQPAPGGRLLVIAIGKAAVPMTEAFLALSPVTPSETLVVTNYENARGIAGARVMPAGHPVPDANGAAAALEVEALLSGAGTDDRVIALISGGGSALLPAPVPGLSLADKAQVNRILLAGGLDITRMNLIRQALSRLKGGGLLRVAAPAPVTAYILSDVIGDDLRAIASGLTVAPIGTRAEACATLHQHQLWAHLPEAARAALTRTDPETPPPPATNILIGSNRKSLEAVQAAAGPDARIIDDALTCDVGEAADRILQAATAPDAPNCLIFGGETLVTLRGTGLGGRNQELALRVAAAMPDLGRDWLFLSGGTDGRDGPTEAAGGLVDAGTLDRIRQAGADPQALLSNNDSNRALGLAGDLLITGATGTNVADVQILLLG